MNEKEILALTLDACKRFKIPTTDELIHEVRIYYFRWPPKNCAVSTAVNNYVRWAQKSLADNFRYSQLREAPYTVQRTDIILDEVDLTDTERSIIRGIYWLSQNCVELGKELGLTKQRVWQIHKAAIGKIREKYHHCL